MPKVPATVSLFDESIGLLLQNGLRISLAQPAMVPTMLRTISNQRKASRVRKAWEEQGVHVPPLAIATVTGRCNLYCTGCYARAQQRFNEEEMSPAKLRSVVAEADELGISIFLITGGEPLMRSELLDITQDYPHILFPLFTNGTLIDEDTIARLARQKHVVPLISLEGRKACTDARRGVGVHDQVLGVMRRMRRRGILFGTSVTVTRDNYDLVTSDAFITELLDVACRVFIYVNYVPLQPGTEHLTLSPEQREQEPSLMQSLRTRLPGFFVAFPGNEAAYGGCLAAGRGLFHIAPSGRLEPCPFASFSDVGLQDLTLKEALQSRLFRAIQGNSERLKQVKGSCVLWENREWVRSLLEEERVAS